MNGAVPISMSDIWKVSTGESPTGVHSKIVTTLTEIEANQKVLMEKHGAVPTSSSIGDVNAIPQNLASRPFFDESSRTFLHFWGDKLYRVPKALCFQVMILAPFGTYGLKGDQRTKSRSFDGSMLRRIW